MGAVEASVTLERSALSGDPFYGNLNLLQDIFKEISFLTEYIQGKFARKEPFPVEHKSSRNN